MFLVVYARLYARAFVDALSAIGRSPWTLLLPIALMIAMYFAMMLVSPLGYAGGFVMAFVEAALSSAYSYFLAMLVTGNTARVTEVRTSLTAYFWNWLNFSFVLWLISLGLDIATKSNPQGRALLIIVPLMELIALNAAPETIYLKGSGNGIETIQRSFGFLQENWIEWFVPNGLIIAGVWFVWTRGLLINFPGGVVALLVIAGALLHVVMVFRGFLFQLLDGSTHRQRMFKFKNSM